MLLKSISWCVLVMLFLTGSSALGMKKLYSHKNKIGGLGILAATAYFSDKYDTREMMEVSTPSDLKKVSELAKLCKGNKITSSVTKDQINHDPVLSLATLDNRSVLTKKQINRLSLLQSWVVMPKFRKELNDLTSYICHEEEVYQKQGYFCCVHGTHQGASMLLRTIFDEVVQDKRKEHFVQMRNPAKMKTHIQQANAHEYYDEKYKAAPRIKETVPTINGQIPTGRTIVYMDLTNNREELLSANLGLYGGSSWITSRRKESSIEFIAKPCSWSYQMLDVLISAYGLFITDVRVLKKVVAEVIKRPSNIAYLPMFIDTIAKDVDDSLMEQVFDEYDAGHLYEKYKDELYEFKKQASAGLVQMMIPHNKAVQWCYISKELGIKSLDCSVQGLKTSEAKQLLPYNQARIVLHPDIIEYDPDHKDKNTNMNFYVLISQEKLKHMVKRMYEIAQEVKNY